VPDRISVCHCGTTREQAARSAAPPEPPPGRAVPAAFGPRPRPGPSEASVLGSVVIAAWPYVILFVLAVSAALAWSVSWRPEPILPVLGYARDDRPTPPPKPTPRPPPRSQ
jgi:hypothetical protein